MLEVGTGSGYQAAILAHLARKVCTIEIIPQLAAAAAKTLKDLAYDNVSVRLGDGYAGWPDCGPFEAIIVTAALGHVPAPLIEQLKLGGRLVMPVGPAYTTQQLTVVEKTGAGQDNNARRQPRAVTLYALTRLKTNRRLILEQHLRSRLAGWSLAESASCSNLSASGQNLH